MNLQVIHEDNHLIAVNKPAGILVHADITEDATLEEYVKKYIKIRYNKAGDVFLGVIHRIDRPVSGVVIFARTSKALTRMNQLFKDREVEKTYWAITRERPSPPENTLVHYIAKDKKINKARTYEGNSKRSQAAKAKRSELSYELLASMDNRNMLKVSPKTGRPHQIRVQLSKIGCPIVGDLKYNYPSPLRDGSIALHSRSLSFIHPVKKEPVVITAAPPVNQVWQPFASVVSF